MSSTLTEMQMRGRIAELEKQISVLLSCKKCPDNKGGYICEKEYNDKCLSQKIQYIKELQEENLKLEAKIRTLEIEQHYCLPNCSKLAELEAQIEKMRNCANCKNYNGNEGFCVLGSGYGYNCNLEKWEIKEK